MDLQCTLEVLCLFFGIIIFVCFVRLVIFPRRHKFLDYVTYLCKKVMNLCRRLRRGTTETGAEEGTVEEKVDLNKKENNGTKSDKFQHRRIPDKVECKFQEIIIPPLRRETRGSRLPPTVVNFIVLKVTTPEQ